MDVGTWAAWLEASSLGHWMRSSALAYPVANVLHLLGLVLLVGPIMILDCRLLGFARWLPLVETNALLTRWAMMGLALLIAAGISMFAADAGPLASNSIMQLKLLLIAAGIANALLFRRLWQQRLASWDSNPPSLGRAQALCSMLIWLVVGTLGRWIAYA